MSSIRDQQAREAVLRRIRTALQDVPQDEQQVAVERDYRCEDTTPHDELIEQFIERVSDYKATVRRVEEHDLPLTIAAACMEHSVQTLVVSADMPSVWLPSDITILRDQQAQPLTYEQLERSDGVLTGCALGIAQTGTIVLDGGKLQGRRVLSLLPDYALCLIWEEQIVGIVPEAIARLNGSIGNRGDGVPMRPITFVSGPSATSDIELSRVEGVHGPRTLEVFVVRHVAIQHII